MKVKLIPSQGNNEAMHFLFLGALFRMAEVGDHSSQVAHKDIFLTDILKYARTMSRG
jgi:hypothetical protein